MKCCVEKAQFQRVQKAAETAATAAQLAETAAQLEETAALLI